MRASYSEEPVLAVNVEGRVGTHELLDGFVASVLSMMVCSLSYLTGVEPKSSISGICISILDPWQITGSMNVSRSI